MAANTNISWVTHTQNFWVGCSKVGPACDHCYAEAWAKRAGAPGLWNGERRRTKTWGDPVKWNKVALKTGTRPSVFSNSLADFFDADVPTQWRTDAWGVVESCRLLDWYLVTKRIPNVFKMLPNNWSQELYSHVVIIITVVTQAEWDRDGARLKALKLKYPWLRVGLSCEPLLEQINLGEDRDWLDWVIVGGESGSHARPICLEWVRLLRDQCITADIPFHFKQWGEWRSELGSGNYRPAPGMLHSFGNGYIARRLGVKNTGRELDGVIHDAGPRLFAA